MRKPLLFSAVFAAFFSPAAVFAQSLEEALTMAYQSNPTIGAERARQDRKSTRLNSIH